MITSKSPQRVLRVAYETGKSLRPYSHRFSPHTYTQAQLFACLVLKEFLRLDYRKLSAVLEDCPKLRESIGLTKVPHFTTFQKASKRLLRFSRAKRLLKRTVDLAVAHGLTHAKVALAALDATGLESRHVSAYYRSRQEKAGKTGGKRKQTHPRHPKMGLVCDVRSHIILAVVPTRGPGPDIAHFRSALDQTLDHARIDTLLADAGYDSEPSHQYARNTCGVRSLIPAKIGRPTEKPPSGYWRRWMSARLHLTRYGHRWQVETDFSMMKRMLGSALKARRYWSQGREMLLMALTLNIMILLPL